MKYDVTILTELNGLIDATLNLLTDSDMSDDSANQFRDEVYNYLNPQQVRLNLIIQNLEKQDANPTRYKIMSDDDGHDFVVPIEKEDAFSKWLEAVYDEDVNEGPMPEGIISIGGSPEQVTFTDPQF